MCKCDGNCSCGKFPLTKPLFSTTEPESNCFPMIVELNDGINKGDVRRIDQHEIPLGISFTVHMINVTDKMYEAFKLGRRLPSPSY